MVFQVTINYNFLLSCIRIILNVFFRKYMPIITRFSVGKCLRVAHNEKYRNQQIVVYSSSLLIIGDVIIYGIY